MERLAGIAIAVLVNLLLAWLLLQAVDLRGVIATGDAPALQVVWIDPAMPKVIDAPADSVAAPAMPRVDPAAVRSAGRSARPAAPSASVASDARDARGDGVHEDALPLDLTLADGNATTPMAFARSNAARPSADAFTVRDRLDVEVRDRSVGGALARMARSSDCAELRAAMDGAAGGGTELDVILKSLQARGCP